MRLLFHFDEAVEPNVRVSGAIIVITFKKPVAVAVEKLSSGASGFISVARRDPDGGAIRIALAQKVKVNTSPPPNAFTLISCLTTGMARRRVCRRR